jgi:hypothetical protein
MSQIQRENSDAKKYFFKDRFSLGLGDFLPSFFPPPSQQNQTKTMSQDKKSVYNNDTENRFYTFISPNSAFRAEEEPCSII